MYMYIYIYIYITEYTYKLFYQQVRPSKKLCAVMTVISSNLVSLFFFSKNPRILQGNVPTSVRLLT